MPQSNTEHFFQKHLRGVCYECNIPLTARKPAPRLDPREIKKTKKIVDGVCHTMRKRSHAKQESGEQETLWRFL
jgi:hypothetical protein